MGHVWGVVWASRHRWGCNPTRKIQTKWEKKGFSSQWKQMLHVNYYIFTLKVIFLFFFLFLFECFSLLYLKLNNLNSVRQSSKDPIFCGLERASASDSLWNVCVFPSYRRGRPARCDLKRGSCYDMTNKTVAELRVLKYTKRYQVSP